LLLCDKKSSVMKSGVLVWILTSISRSGLASHTIKENGSWLSITNVNFVYNWS